MSQLRAHNLEDLLEIAGGSHVRFTKNGTVHEGYCRKTGKRIAGKVAVVVEGPISPDGVQIINYIFQSHLDQGMTFSHL
ncbi:MAG TPA: hypothetical protein VLI92_04285 [Candidatus Saccharimonadales bacterium]|nr:hypothetical protein [Candidatus Saccharimonadales bacterium]